MARNKTQEQELRVKGLSIWAKFTLSMTLALAVVMAIAGYMLYSSSLNLAHGLQEQTMVEATKLAVLDLKFHGSRNSARKGEPGYWQDGDQAKAFDKGKVRRFQIRYGDDELGWMYQGTKNDQPFNVIVPQRIGESLQKGLLGLIIAISAGIVLIGAIVSFLIANQVSKPLETLIDDIRQIAHGNLRHKTRVRSGGEVALLARTVDRMTASLAEAQEAELELSIRDRESEVAGEVREALLSDTTPQAEGYDVSSLHLSSATPGGDFHDFVEYSDGRLGLMACDVSGTGVPGALVGATARAYLKAFLADADDVEEALRRVNRELARDLKRGMYVSLLYALIDPAQHTAKIFCAGHKIALVRFSAEDGNVRLIHPEGIALGFDKGPVFDRSIEAQEIPFEVGDRLFLSNTGPLKVVDPDDVELGEKGFFRTVLRHAQLDSDAALDGVADDLEEFADDDVFPADITFVTVRRTH